MRDFSYTAYLCFSGMLTAWFIICGPVLSFCTEDTCFDFAPIISKDKSLDGADRMRILGPLSENAGLDKAGGKMEFKAFRPIFSMTEDKRSEDSIGEILWPVASWRDKGKESYWRFLTITGHDFDSTNDQSRYRFMAFPFIYAGRSVDKNRYFAFFPIGGKVNELLFQDEIVFALFPLYAYTRQDETVTHNVLWPIISKSQGGRVDAFRIFPFYMRSSREGRWDKKSVMWPIWTSVDYHYDNDRGGGVILFPLFGRIETEKQLTWWIIPPLFQWSRSDEGKRIYCPWPFVQYSSAGYKKKYIWPLWGKKTAGDNKSFFLLWPVVRGASFPRGDGIRRTFKILPVVYYDDHIVENREYDNGTGKKSEASEKKVTARYLKIWPLFSYRREENQLSCRILSLWPVKYSPPVERNWAPLWTLFSSMRSGSKREDELLWGLVSRKKDGDEYKRWSFLMGLFQYERNAGEKEVRLLHFLRFGKSGQDSDK